MVLDAIFALLTFLPRPSAIAASHRVMDAIKADPRVKSLDYKTDSYGIWLNGVSMLRTLQRSDNAFEVYYASAPVKL